MNNKRGCNFPLYFVYIPPHEVPVGLASTGQILIQTTPDAALRADFFVDGEGFMRKPNR